MNAKSLIGSLLVLVASQSPAAFANPDGGCAPGLPPAAGQPGDRGAAGEMPLPPFLRQLKLSDAQQDKLFALMHEQAARLRELGKAQRKAQDGLRELGFAASYDDGKAKALTDAAARAGAELALLRVRSEHRIYELLSPEQRQQLADQLARRGMEGGDEPGARRGPR